LAPAARLAAFTIRVAVAAAPDPVREAVPSTTVPALNVTLPPGVALPLAALTVAVSCVVPLAGMFRRVAASEVDVETAGAVTAT
jgi:hypothetical protein